MLFLFRHLFHMCFLPSPVCPGSVLAAPRFGSLPGALPVIPLKIYDSHKKPETARAQAPGGAAVLESLFEGADRLTLKVRCDPQMCHLVQKKLLFFPPWQCLFRRNTSERNLGVIFELFVLCLPFDRTSLSCVNCKADRGPDGIEQLHQQRRDNEQEKSCVRSMTSSLYISLFFLSVSFCLLCKYHFYANHVCWQHNDFNAQTEVVQPRFSSLYPRSRSPFPTSALFNVTEQRL